MPRERIPWPVPPHVVQLNQNIDAILRLEKQVAQVSKGPGARRDTHVLTKSAVVLLVACWEAFVEDLATSGFDALVAQAATPSVLPPNVLAFAGKSLRESKDERDLWKLAGDGWRDVLKHYRTSTLERYVGKLNTPRPAQVDELIERMIGLRSLSSAWHWRGATVGQNRSRLEELVSSRGEIAHTVATGRAVPRIYVGKSYNLIYDLAVTSSNAVAIFIRHQVGDHPWRRVRHGSVH